MSDFVRMDALPINSISAAASLSMADAKYDGVRKKHDINTVSWSNRFLSWAVGLVAVSSIVAALYAMWIEASLVVYIAFVAPLITGPMVLVQRKNLQWMPSKCRNRYWCSLGPPRGYGRRLVSSALTNNRTALTRRLPLCLRFT